MTASTRGQSVPEHAKGRVISFLRASVVGGAALALIGSAAIVADGQASVLWSELLVVILSSSVFFAVIVWLVAPGKPRNGVVWTMASSAFFGGVWIAGLSLASSLVDDPTQVLLGAGAEEVAPADLPVSAAWVLMLTQPALILSTFPLLTYGFLLFPDGRLPSRGWRWVGGLAGVGLAMVMVGWAWSFRPASTEPVQEGRLLILYTGFAALVPAMLLSVAALSVRYRHTAGATRQQIKWVVWGASIFGPTMVAVVFLRGTQHEDLIRVPALAATLVFLVSYGVAVGRYRLYDIDLVISKSVTYVGLAATISALYAGVVVLPLLVVGLPESGGPGLTLPIAATAVVAIFLEPTRVRMQRWANRLVYGNRSTPQEVLSQLTSRLSETARDGGTNDLARLLAEGTGANQAIVWIGGSATLHPVGTWPADGSVSFGPVERIDLVDDETTASRPVRHEADLLGAVSITKPGNDPVAPADCELIEDVAAGAGLVLRNINLNRQLEQRAREVRESRRRLITAQDSEAHRLERNLHDGAQQQVVALKVKLGLAKAVAQKEGADDIATLVDGLAASTEDAVDAMRAVAHGIYPPLLEAEGLEVTLNALARPWAKRLTIVASELGRFAPEVESTAYFCVREAAHGAHMAGARETHVDLTSADGELVIVIAHDAPVSNGDITVVSDRVDAFGGSVTIAHPSASNTLMTCRLPTSEHALEPASR